ncbi:MAG: hypothetical protein C0518_15765 [Opitutus sp.]|nr:hypothetical protein [Opitutus sp.]
MRRWLKPLRVLLGLIVLAGLTAAFVDFRGLIPAPVAHALASLQLAPALLVAISGGLAGAVILVALTFLTLLFGRVYCSVLCPLGVLQDVIARLAAGLGHRPLRFARELPWLRYGVLFAVLLAAFVGAGGFAVTLTDPYSNFGRLASGVLRPLVVSANNLFTPAAQSLDVHAWYHVPVAWPPWGVTLFAAVFFGLVVSLAALRGRLYCNTLCPVGTLLGLVARFAVFRLVVDRTACTKCAQCLDSCKAQCIELRHREIDASRCVACFNCLGACEQGALRYRFSWTATPTPASAPTQIASAAPINAPRRAFLGGTLLLPPLAFLRAAESVAPAAALLPPVPTAPVAPPGAGSVARLLDRCTACQLCVSACPTQALQPSVLHYGWSGLAKPRLDFERAFCNFDCHRCAEVCPTGAIATLAREEKRRTSIGAARFERSLCIVETAGTDCAACSEHCPTKAVETVPFRNNLRLPQVRDELCIGCGACEFVCPVRPRRAILVVARAEHTRAAKAVEAAPVIPRKTDDFPF